MVSLASFTVGSIYGQRLPDFQTNASMLTGGTQFNLAHTTENGISLSMTGFITLFTLMPVDFQNVEPNQHLFPN